MAESDDDVPTLNAGDEAARNEPRGSSSQEKKRSTEIPNFRGKVPDADKDDESKGNLQIHWKDDDDDDDDDFDSEDFESDEEEGGEAPAEGEVGEEFAKARRQAKKERREKREAEDAESDGEEPLEEEDLWNFPRDKDNWEEEDIGEEWADAWAGDEEIGWDPDLVEDWDEVEKLWNKGEGPPIRPYYVPYRKYYPLIPEDHPDIQTPQDVVHELERYEEFLDWASYIFKDGSSYEGTVFDDLAHGRGVYTTALDLCKYEGEWFQNSMQGHGVLEVDIPQIEPPPDSAAAKKLREQGKLLQTDFMDPEDKEWLKMDVEDTLQYVDDAINPKQFEDDEAWVKAFGEKPEKGHYTYSGQWKHSRMHGCGVFEINSRQIFGRFYFGQLLPEPGPCNEDLVAIHSGMAKIAAAKARMFVRKPDGMVREAKGPYSDPSHPYMYEEEDLWMAPGFINEFYPVPETWQRYVEEVDEEQEMWLNSFIKSPFRVPGPSELEYQWAKDDEFILLSNRDSDPLYQYPENLDPAVEGEILLHTPTGRLINWAEDPEGNLRFFVQPYYEDGAVKPEMAIPLPLGFEEFMGEVDEEGNVIDESRRGLSIEELEKLKKEDKKKAKKAKLAAKIEEIKRRTEERVKEIETQKYILELERKLEDIRLDERLVAKLDAVYEDMVEAKKEKGGEKGAVEETEGSEGLPTPKEEAAKKEEKPDDGDDDDGGADAGDDEEEDDDDKPRSFGKVAMILPQEMNEKKPVDGSTGPPFPTVFASLSLVPHMALKKVIESSVRSAQRALSSKFGPRLTDSSHRHIAIQQPFGGGRASDTVQLLLPGKGPLDAPASNSGMATNVVVRKNANIASLQLQQNSGSNFARGSLKQRRIPAAEGLLSALKPRSRRDGSNPNRTRRYRPPGNSDLWDLPHMEALCIALPVQVL